MRSIVLKLGMCLSLFGSSRISCVTLVSKIFAWKFLKKYGRNPLRIQKDKDLCLGKQG